MLKIASLFHRTNAHKITSSLLTHTPRLSDPTTYPLATMVASNRTPTSAKSPGKLRSDGGVVVR